MPKFGKSMEKNSFKVIFTLILSTFSVKRSIKNLKLISLLMNGLIRFGIYISSNNSF